jgi:hypothetical protein
LPKNWGNDLFILGIIPEHHHKFGTQNVFYFSLFQTFFDPTPGDGVLDVTTYYSPPVRLV